MDETTFGYIKDIRESGEKLVVATTKGLYTSLDAGNTFQRVSSTFFDQVLPLETFVLSFKAESGAFFDAGVDAMRSANGGSTFTKVGESLVNASRGSVSGTPSLGIYFGDRQSGVYKFSSDGTSYTKINTQTVKTLSVNCTGDLLASSGSGASALVSKDGGTSFIAKPIPNVSSVWQVAGEGNSIIAKIRLPTSSVHEILATSIDGGQTWRQFQVRGGTEMVSDFYVHNGKVYVTSNINGSTGTAMIFVSK